MSEIDVIEGDVVEETEESRAVAVVPVAPTSLAVAPEIGADELVARMAVIQQAADKAMVANVDYGVIPGTDKPTLLKPGAEKLGVLFQLDIQITSEKTWGPGDHLTVVSKATAFHAPSGSRLGFGEGICSTRERKYGIRQGMPTCPNCGKQNIRRSKNPTPQESFYCWAKKGGCGAKFGDHDATIVNQPQGDIPNPNPADLVNTLQKMAQKRALVAATLLAVNASEFFTQDVEDMAGFGDDIIDGQWMPADTLNDERQAGPPPVQQRKQRVSKPAPPEELQGADELDELFYVDPESALFKGFMARGLAKFGDEWDEKRRAAVSKTTKGRTTSSLECTPAEIAKMNRFLGPVSDEEE